MKLRLFRRTYADAPDDELDRYRDSANSRLDEVRKYCRQKYGDDRDTLHHEVGKRLQYYIDSMNEQGSPELNRYALARWQIYRALYPEYIRDDPPTPRPEIWN